MKIFIILILWGKKVNRKAQDRDTPFGSIKISISPET